MCFDNVLPGKTFIQTQFLKNINNKNLLAMAYMKRIRLMWVYRVANFIHTIPTGRSLFSKQKTVRDHLNSPFAKCLFEMGTVLPHTKIPFILTK